MNRLFTIHELVSLILHQTDPQTLLNCQRVCRLWKDITEDSQELQERLFLVSATSCSEPRLNPFLTSHFSPLLGPHQTLTSKGLSISIVRNSSTYEDSLKLPWARDGTHTSAAARQAFARADASWRRMHISHPPIVRLDWLYKFESQDRRALNDDEQALDSRWASVPILHGNGIAQQHFEALTLGLLWDFLESRLARGCTVRTTYFPLGGSAFDDPTATGPERAWEDRLRNTDPTSMPRVRVDCTQIWPGQGPEMWQKFHIGEGRWEIRDELPFTPETDAQRLKLEAMDGHAMRALNKDCAFDSEPENWRWSRSDGFQLGSLDKIGNYSIGGGGGRRSERIRARMARRRSLSSFRDRQFVQDERV